MKKLYLLSAIALTLSLQAMDPADNQVPQLPADAWSHIFTYLPSNLTFVNEMSRQNELSQETYDGLVEAFCEAYINNPEQFYPTEDQALQLVHDKFYTTSSNADKAVFQEKIKKALVKYMKNDIFGKYQSLVTSNDHEALLSQLKFDFQREKILARIDKTSLVQYFVNLSENDLAAYKMQILKFKKFKDKLIEFIKKNNQTLVSILPYSKKAGAMSLDWSRVAAIMNEPKLFAILNVMYFSQVAVLKMIDRHFFSDSISIPQLCVFPFVLIGIKFMTKGTHKAINKTHDYFKLNDLDSVFAEIIKLDQSITKIEEVLNSDELNK